MDVKVPVGKFWGTAVRTIAPFDLLEARADLGEESFPLVGKPGVRVNDNLKWPPLRLPCEGYAMVIQECKERSCIVRIKIPIDALAQR